MYLLIAYKSSGANYCRGCLMESWSSQLEMFNHLDCETLKGKLTEFIIDNLTERLYGSYEFTVYRNGICIHDEINGRSWDGYERGKHLEYNSNEYFEFEIQDEQEQKEANAEFLPILEEANQLAKQFIERQKQLEQEQKVLKAEQQKIKEQENRKQQYEQLKKEFENVDR